LINTIYFNVNLILDQIYFKLKLTAHVLAGFAYLLLCGNGAGSTAGCVSSLISDDTSFRAEQLEFCSRRLQIQINKYQTILLLYIIEKMQLKCNFYAYFSFHFFCSTWTSYFYLFKQTVLDAKRILWSHDLILCLDWLSQWASTKLCKKNSTWSITEIQIS